MQAAAPVSLRRFFGRTAASRSEYMVSPRYDLVFFIFSPVLALLLSRFLDGFAWPFEPTRFLGGTESRISFFIAIWTYGHVCAVVFRSYGNPVVFERYRTRLIVFPLVLFPTLMISDFAFSISVGIIVVWDVYHTAMQTFGFCRIYDAKAGNSAVLGRRLDYWMNLLVYVGPHICALGVLGVLEGIDEVVFGRSAARVEWRSLLEPFSTPIVASVLVAGCVFTVVYVAIFYRWWKRGEYQVSLPKLLLLGSTAAVSIYVWGFRPPVEAFFVSNFFHALQYFALLWWSDRKSIQRVFGLSRLRSAGWIAFAPFVAVAFIAGSAYESTVFNNTLRWAACTAMVMSFMHFWYDGFIWSVRRSEVL